MVFETIKKSLISAFLYEFVLSEKSRTLSLHVGFLTLLHICLPIKSKAGKKSLPLNRRNCI